MSRKFATLVLAALGACPSYAHADASIPEWVGEYSMNHDGHRGTLTIRETKADCKAPSWCALSISYRTPKGESFAGRIIRIDDRGQHMRFTLAFPGNEQGFDAYIFSWDKSSMAGTTVWDGRTFGFLATRGPASGAAGGGQSSGTGSAGKSRLLPDGSVEVTHPDGTVVVHHSGGGRTITMPSGTTRRELFVQAPVPVDPTAGSDLERWLNGHGDQLLGILRTVVGDEPTVQAYLNNEQSEASAFRRVQRRSAAIKYLLGP